jgi:hypothetical protein
MITLITLFGPSSHLQHQWDGIIAKNKYSNLSIVVNLPPTVPKLFTTPVDRIYNEPLFGQPYPFSEVDRINHIAAIYNKIIPAVEDDIIIILEDDVLVPGEFIQRMLILLTEEVDAVSGVYNFKGDAGGRHATVNVMPMDDVFYSMSELPDIPFQAWVGSTGFMMVKKPSIIQCLPFHGTEITGPGGFSKTKGWDWNLGHSFEEKGLKFIVDPLLIASHG